MRRFANERIHHRSAYLRDGLACGCGLVELMKLQMLKPRLQAISTNRIKVLETKAGATEMERGRAWMAKRERVAVAHGYLCAKCGLVWRNHIDQIDHIIPREQGGSNDESNLQPLCKLCHDAKTAEEAKRRARG